MSDVAEASAADLERDALLEQLTELAALIRKIEAERDAAYVHRLKLYQRLKERGTVHRRIARAAGVSETAVSLALKKG